MNCGGKNHEKKWDKYSLKVINFEFSPYLVTCGHPFQDKISVDEYITINGYMDPALEGAVLTFVCPLEHTLVGPNSTTCMGNGEWELDPREVECKGTYNFLLK